MFLAAREKTHKKGDFSVFCADPRGGERGEIKRKKKEEESKKKREEEEESKEKKRKKKKRSGGGGRREEEGPLAYQIRPKAPSFE